MMKAKMDEKAYQTNINLERDLCIYMRQYFVLEKAASLRQYCKDENLERTSRLKTIFKEYHDNILNDLNVASAPGKIRIDRKYFHELSDTVDEYAALDNSIKRIRTHLKEIERMTSLCKVDVQQLRKKQFVYDQVAIRHKNAMQIIETLENKLETQVQKFGTTCSQNRELRERINHLLKERQLFMKQFNKLINKLAEGKKVMLDLIEQATLAYNQREEWCNKLQFLRIQAFQDLQKNTSTVQSLERKISHMEKIKEFYAIKNQRRNLEALKEQEKARREITYNKTKEKFEKYWNIVKDIKEFINNKRIRTVATMFYKTEEKNMSKFNFVIETIQEMNILGDQLGSLHMKTEEERLLHQRRAIQQETTIKTLRGKLEEEKSRTKEAKEKLQGIDGKHNELLRGVYDLFTICKCDKDPLMNLLGDNRNVQFYNVSLYLKMLESKVSQLLLGANFKDEEKKPELKIFSTKQEVPMIHRIESIVPSTPCAYCIEHETVSDLISTRQTAYSRDVAKRKLAEILTEMKQRNLHVVHTISHCKLPKSRKLMQKIYTA